jgi:hypothetical protein
MAEKTVEQYLDEQRAEWGAYVATVPIDVNGARAFNPGDPVPASHVTGGVVRKDEVRPVKATDTKES